MPSSTLPPLMASTVRRFAASTPGRRNVTGDTSVPRRTRVVSRASPASVVQASVGTRVGVVRVDPEEVAERKKASNPASSVARASASVCSYVAP